MDCQRNVHLSATTPLLMHPPVSYDSLTDGYCALPFLAAPAAAVEWADEADIVEQLSQLPVPYTDLQRTAGLEESEVGLLRALFDNVELEERLTAVRRRPAEYAALFHRLLSTVRDDRLQTQLVATLHSLVMADEAVQHAFASPFDWPDRSIVQPLRRLLHATFEQPDHYRELPPYFVPARLCELITTLLQATLPATCCTERSHWPSEALSRDMLDWLLHQPLCLPPSESSVPMLAAALKSLRSLIWYPPLLTFFHGRDGVVRVARLLIPAILDHTYQYHLALVLWLATFCDGDHFPSYDVLPHLLHLLSCSKLEKCIRLYLRIVHRLLQLHQADGALLEYAVEAAVPAQLRSLSQRQWLDADVVELIAALQSVLSAAEPQLSSSWTLYRAELLSASLHPSPPHSSPAFFQRHLELFAANHAAVVCRLLGLLDDRRVSSLSRATAAWDLGQLARCGSAGKRLLLLGAGGVKEALLRAANENSEAEVEVRRAALLALQKLLVPRWDDFERHCTLEAAHLATRPPLLAQLPEDGIQVGYADLHSSPLSERGTRSDSCVSK